MLLDTDTPPGPEMEAVMAKRSRQCREPAKPGPPSRYPEIGMLSAGVRALVLLALLGLTTPVSAGAVARRAGYLGPCSVVASKDAGTLYIANADARQLAFVDVSLGRVTRSVSLPAKPTGVAISPDGTRLYVTCAAARSTVWVVDASSGAVRGRISVGHTARGPVVSPDGKRLYVCNRFDNDISVIDVESGRQVSRVPAIREPVAADLTPDGKLLLVANHLPDDRADSLNVSAAVTIVDTRTGRAGTVRLSGGATGLRGLCVLPGGKYACVTHVLARYELPCDRVDHGWMNANALSVIDTAGRKLLGTVLLDEMRLGAGNPWGVACSPDGKRICVTHAGTGELSVIDAPALLRKLLAMPVKGKSNALAGVGYDDRNELLDYFRRARAERLSKGAFGYHDVGRLYMLGDAAGVSNDLTFLSALRRRIRLGGNGPRGLAVAGSKVYVAEYFTDTLSVVDLRSATPRRVVTIAMGPKPRLTPQRRGEMLFHDARLCFQHWQSCASCHPAARMDAMNWDLLNDGMGNLKNTKSLLLTHKTPPAMSTGVRASAGGAVRSGLEHILFRKHARAEAEAIDAYLKSLRPVPSPHLVGGRLGPPAKRGKILFGQMGCAKCHPPPLYTDRRMYDVGSKGPCDYHAKFDTPSLIEAWRTSPYMHDGRYKTVGELITKGRHGRRHGPLDGLNDKQIEDLVKFVLSL